MSTALLVAVSGGIGAVTRFVVDDLVQSRTPGEFPFGTLVVNLTGCFLLGLLSGTHASHSAVLVLGTATIGSYTTFSTWMLEVHRPAEDGERGSARRNFIISLLAGFVAVALGRAIGRLL